MTFDEWKAAVVETLNKKGWKPGQVNSALACRAFSPMVHHEQGENPEQYVQFLVEQLGK